MKTIFCTLFNHYYLDKGLVLYDSLKEVSKDFRLYILCMDDKCYDVFIDINYSEIVPIKLSDFEDDEMLEAKSNRTFGEYCWTCSSSFLLYVLEKYKEPICTYIDADMYFYRDPEILIDEMLNAGKKVMITPHRFSPANKHLERNGLYCVEFNTFINNSQSLNILKRWKQECIDCCTSVNDGIHFGDQKYLDTWPDNYPDIIHVCQNWGAGIAPWNIEFFRRKNSNIHIVSLNDKNILVPIIFYHFADITYISKNKIRTGVLANIDTIDYELVRDLYVDYLNKIEEKKKYLRTKYGIEYMQKSHPAYKSKNKCKEFLKNNRVFRKLQLFYISQKRSSYIIEFD